MGTGDSVSAEIVMNFATKNVACSFCSSISASHDNTVVMLASAVLCVRATGVE